jgi:NAD(P)-dependent dehydrogenase (short-subunit alcohol dehydrogenase family)
MSAYSNASGAVPPTLKDRRVFITGASRGVGLESARLFLQSGARVIGAAKDPGHLEAAAEQLRSLGEFHSLVLDLSQPGFEPAAVAAVARHFGGALDILFNNAGTMPAQQSIPNEPAGSLEKTLQVNLVAVHNLTRALLPALFKGNEPRIMNTSSGAGTLGAVGENSLASYRVSKFALNGLTLNWAGALKGRVAVNAFDPGWVRTAMGGPNAPGTPQDSARGALALALRPFATTGRFWKDGNEIPW